LLLCEKHYISMFEYEPKIKKIDERFQRRRSSA